MCVTRVRVRGATVGVRSRQARRQQSPRAALSIQLFSCVESHESGRTGTHGTCFDQIPPSPSFVSLSPPTTSPSDPMSTITGSEFIRVPVWHLSRGHRLEIFLPPSAAAPCPSTVLSYLFRVFCLLKGVSSVRSSSADSCSGCLVSLNFIAFLKACSHSFSLTSIKKCSEALARTAVLINTTCTEW